MRKRGVCGFLLSLAVIFNLLGTPLAARAESTEQAAVSTLLELKSALADEAVQTVVVKGTIDISGEAIDGGGKTIQVEKPGRTDTGAIRADRSVYSVFTNRTTASLSNATVMGGGATAIKNDGGMTLDQVVVTGVYADRDHGGALYNTGKMYVKNSLFKNNAADAGGAFYNNQATALLVMENSSCVENIAVAGGGGAGEVSNGADLYCNNVVFADNQTYEYGGALNIYLSGDVYLQNCTIAGNISTPRAGAVTCRSNSGTRLEMVNCLMGYNYYQTGNTWLTSDVNNLNSADACIVKNSAYMAVGGSISQTDNLVIDHAETVFSSVAAGTVLNLRNNSFYEGTIARPLLIDNTVKLTSAGSAALAAGCDTYWQVDPGDFSVKTDSSAPPVTACSDGTGRPAGGVGAASVTDKTYYRLRMIMGADSYGTVSGSSIFGETYEAGAQVELNAAPHWFSRFESWSDVNSGEILATTERYVVTVDKNMDLTADFALLDGLEYKLLAAPQPQEVTGGEPAVFSVETSGKVSYQWYFLERSELSNEMTDVPMCGLTWRKLEGGPNAGWYASANQGIGNSSSAIKSEVFTVSEASKLQFQWKVSGENYYDKLSYTLVETEGQRVVKEDQISGVQKPQQVEIPLDPGSYQLTFAYAKDGVSDEGEDTGYMRDAAVVKNSGEDPVPLVFDTEKTVLGRWEPSDQHADRWFAEISGGAIGNCSLVSQEFTVSGNGALTLSCRLVEKTDVNANFSAVVRNGDGAIVSQRSVSAGDPQDLTFQLHAGTYRVEWTYTSYGYSGSAARAELEVSRMVIEDRHKIDGADQSVLTVSPEVNGGYYRSGGFFFCSIEYISSFAPVITSYEDTDRASLTLYYTVSPPEGDSCKIIPAAGQSNRVRSGDDYRFTIELADGYQGNHMAVTANGRPLTADERGIYTLSNINAHQQITVAGVTEVLDRIELQTMPGKTSYTEGESFDAAGMKVLAVYRTGSTKDITALCTWDRASLHAGAKEVIVSYTEDGKTYTASCPVAVAEKDADGIPVTGGQQTCTLWALLCFLTFSAVIALILRRKQSKT